MTPRPDESFERGVKAIDSGLRLDNYGVYEGQSGWWLMEHRAGRDRWLMFVPRNRQDDMMLTTIRGCDTWQPDKLAAFRRDMERERDEKYMQTAGRADRDSRSAIHEVLDRGTKFFPGLPARQHATPNLDLLNEASKNITIE